MRNVVSAITLTFYTLSAFSREAIAGPEIVTVRKGDVVPFDGTLFNVTAAAKLAVDLEFNEETCKIESDHALGVQETTLRLETQISDAKLQACQERSSLMEEISAERISFLEDQLSKNRGPGPVVWLASGVGGGILLTLASAWAVRQASTQ
jgi:hypothetical protein